MDESRDVTGRGKIVRESRTYEYLLVKPRVGEELNMGNLFVVYQPTENLLMVSTDCPESYRDLWIGHELSEHHLGHPISCCKALAQEITLVNERGLDPAAYFTERQRFFRALYWYLRSKQCRTSREEKIMEGAKESLDVLTDMLAVSRANAAQ
jgi:hypothetical protein